MNPIENRLTLVGANDTGFDLLAQHGCLFVPTNKEYKIGDEVFMLLNLMDEPEKIPIAGKVVWITPKGAQGNRTAGIGVQFSEEDAQANNKIENHLAGSLESDRPTHTM